MTSKITTGFDQSYDFAHAAACKGCTEGLHVAALTAGGTGAADGASAPMQRDIAVSFSLVAEAPVGGVRTRGAPRSRFAVEAAVSQVFDVMVDDLRRASRGRARVALARQVAMYLSHVGFGLSLTEVGRLFERDRTTVAHACSVVEDRRDDATFDRTLELLEWASRAIACNRSDEAQTA